MPPSLPQQSHMQQQQLQPQHPFASTMQSSSPPMRSSDLPGVGGGVGGGMAPMMQPQNDFHDRHGDHRGGGGMGGGMGDRRQYEWGGPKGGGGGFGPRDSGYMNGSGGRGDSGNMSGNTWSSSSPTSMSPGGGNGGKAHPLLETLRAQNEYNPRSFDFDCKNARFFVIKSFSEDDIHRSIKYEIWCSTDHGNKRLDAAFKERQGKGSIYLFFSVNGSGHFCGIAQMLTDVNYNTAGESVWVQDKFKGQFKVRWVYVKDVPNGQLRHIRLENNENKPVTNSRDTQEVPPEKGRQVLKIIHTYKHQASASHRFLVNLSYTIRKLVSLLISRLYISRRPPSLTTSSTTRSGRRRRTRRRGKPCTTTAATTAVATAAAATGEEGITGTTTAAATGTGTAATAITARTTTNATATTLMTARAETAAETGPAVPGAAGAAGARAAEAAGAAE